MKLLVLLVLASCGAEASQAAQQELPQGLSNTAGIAAITGLPAPADGGFSFIVLGDNRSGSDTFSALVSQINNYMQTHAGANRPQFVIHTGDIVPGGALKDWQRFAELRVGLQLPIVFVRGNHELASSQAASNYSRIVGPTEWAFDFGNCRFIGLDNATGVFSQQSIDFLKASLGASSVAQSGQGPEKRTWQHVFVAFHQPPPIGRWRVHSMHDDAHGGHSGEVMQLLRSSKVSAVFLGHIHLYDEMDIDGIPYIISGGAGAPLYSRFGFGRAEHGFTVVDVSPDGIRWHWVPLAH